MGVEIQSKIDDGSIDSVVAGGATPVILGLQPSALVDHVARVDCSLLSRIPGESGGSFPVNPSSSYSLSLSQLWVLMSFWDARLISGSK